MPRVRARVQFRHLTHFERGRIVGLHESRIGFRKIARRIKANPSTILRVWKRWTEDETYRRRGGSGRPRHIRGRDLRHLRHLALRDRQASVHQIRDELVRASGRYFSRISVNRRLLAMGLRAFRPLYVFPLTPQHRAHRLEWCRLRPNWNHEWNSIFFSDELRFCLGHSRHNIEFAQERNTARRQV